MPTRVRSELRRVVGQRWVWAFGAVVIVVASWSARWSPTLIASADPASSFATPPFDVRWQLSLAGSLEIALVQVATGLGVMLMALFTAAGPGVDFVDDSAELRRVNGRPGIRFGARVAAVFTLGIGAVLAATAGLIAVAFIGHLRNGEQLAFTMGGLNSKLALAAVALIAVHACWIVALSQVLRTQAAQLACPVGIVLAMFLLSRLLAVPVTPDAWFGPFLELHSDRSMLDFWWSVGGRMLWPWGNAVLLAVLSIGACLIGVRTDRRPALRG